MPAEEEDVCAVIVLQRLETRVSKLKEVRAEQKEGRKLSKCNVYTWTQWALPFAGYVLLCGSIVMLILMVPELGTHSKPPSSPVVSAPYKFHSLFCMHPSGV